MIPKKGQLLIAEPSILQDTSFNRSIILLVNCTQDGSVGFILNKSSRFRLKDFVPEIGMDFEIYLGGPVEQENLYFIHTRPDLIEHSLQITNDLYWGGDFNQLIRHLNDSNISRDEIKFFLGYSGWDKAQLENEIKEKSWIVTHIKHKSNLTNISNAESWKKTMMELGGEYPLWANAPEDPTFN